METKPTTEPTPTTTRPITSYVLMGVFFLFAAILVYFYLQNNKIKTRLNELENPKSISQQRQQTQLTSLNDYGEPRSSTSKILIPNNPPTNSIPNNPPTNSIPTNSIPANPIPTNPIPTIPEEIKQMIESSVKP